jgi:hypothetical protein
MMVNYYRRFFLPDHTAFYVPARDWPADGVSWYITHQTAPGIPQPVHLSAGGWLFQKTAEFPFYGPSGIHWTLYRRAGPDRSSEH